MFLKTLLVAALVSLSATSALAQSAQELFQRGQREYEIGNYEAAVDLWTQAYNLDSRPALQYNLAQAYERLGRLDQAVRSFELYIAAAPPDDERAANARQRVQAIRIRLTNTGVVFEGGPEGAQIFIDGQDRGRLPHPDPLRVDPGSHRIVIRHEGYQDFVSVVAVSPGQNAEVAVEMQRGQSGTANLGGGGPSLVGIIVTAVGGAMIVGGAITGSLAYVTADGLENEEDPAISDARTLALVTDVLLPIGAAALVAGVVLMIVLQEGGGGAAQVVPMIGPDVAGLGVTGAF